MLRHNCLVTHAAEGLCDHEGQPIAESCLQRGPLRELEYPFGLPEKLSIPVAGPVEQLGTVIFLPFVRFHHFGHLLTETAGWLAALLDPAVDLLGLAGSDALILLAANSEEAVEDVQKIFGLPPERVICTTAIGGLAS